MTKRDLGLREEKFARLAVELGNESEALRRAYLITRRMTKNEVRQAVAKVKANPAVGQRMQEIRMEYMREADIDVAAVLREYWDIATADPAELIRFRRLSCRHCWGNGFGYQWRDEAEYEKACEAIERANARLDDNMAPSPLPSARGGFGFDPYRPTNDNCPECAGEGVGDVFVEDTSKLSRKAARLYAGIKVTQHGVEVKMRDQDKALDFIANFLGMKGTEPARRMPWRDVAGQLPAEMPSDPQQAALFYRDFIKNG